MDRKEIYMSVCCEEKTSFSLGEVETLEDGKLKLLSGR